MNLKEYLYILAIILILIIISMIIINFFQVDTLQTDIIIYEGNTTMADTIQGKGYATPPVTGKGYATHPVTGKGSAKGVGRGGRGRGGGLHP